MRIDHFIKSQGNSRQRPHEEKFIKYHKSKRKAVEMPLKEAKGDEYRVRGKGRPKMS